MTLKIGNLSLSVPIIQGGMGVGVSLSGLASAVANEGGVGVISCAGLGLLYRNASENFQTSCIEGLKKELRLAREKTKGVIGVNIMVALTNYADMVKTSIAEKVDIIFSGAGLPSDLPSFLTKDSNTKLVPIVSSTRALKIIFEKWKNNYNYIPDAVVVEGPKAGGHLGYKESQIDDIHFSLEEIIPEIVKEVRIYEEMYGKKIPVFAGGGIYTGEDIAKMIELGASGVQMGTIFVTTEECDADIAFKKTYIDAKEGDIEIIRSPVGMPGRAIFNDFIRRVKSGETQPKSCPFHCIKTCDISKSPYCIILALYNAFKGNLEKGYAFAGSNAWKAEKITTVKETISKIMEEFKESIKNRLPIIEKY
jgi:NAD(P)H-dependent flavin oxidoreductase YrpB (nitropropane dioxygenase family)